jgi:hypothetical protein
MQNWIFDSIKTDWNGGIIGVDRRAQFKINKLRYHQCVEIIIRDKPNGNIIYKDKINQLDYENQDFEKIKNEKHYEIWTKIWIIKK